MLKLSVVGVFKEGGVNDKFKPYRSFHRNFICLPVNGGLSIVNDQLSIANLSFALAKNYKQEKSAGQMEVFPIEQQQKSISSNSIPQADSIEQQREQMIAQFSRETNLKLNWSKE
jgi:hypothetical protein